jgi:2'-5' RNA ligase
VRALHLVQSRLAAEGARYEVVATVATEVSGA